MKHIRLLGPDSSLSKDTFALSILFDPEYFNIRKKSVEVKLGNESNVFLDSSKDGFVEFDSVFEIQIRPKFEQSGRKVFFQKHSNNRCVAHIPQNIIPTGGRFKIVLPVIVQSVGLPKSFDFEIKIIDSKSSETLNVTAYDIDQYEIYLGAPDNGGNLLFNQKGEPFGLLQAIDSQRLLQSSLLSQLGKPVAQRGFTNVSELDFFKSNDGSKMVAIQIILNEGFPDSKRIACVEPQSLKAASEQTYFEFLSELLAQNLSGLPVFVCLDGNVMPFGGLESKLLLVSNSDGSWDINFNKRDILEGQQRYDDFSLENHLLTIQDFVESQLNDLPSWFNARTSSRRDKIEQHIMLLQSEMNHS